MPKTISSSGAPVAVCILGKPLSPKWGTAGDGQTDDTAPNEYREKFCGTRRRALPFCAGGSAVVRGADVRLAGWLRRCALAQHPGLVLPLMDGLRPGGHSVGTC